MLAAAAARLAPELSDESGGAVPGAEPPAVGSPAGAGIHRFWTLRDSFLASPEVAVG
jgi:hypothetical protein